MGKHGRRRSYDWQRAPTFAHLPDGLLGKVYRMYVSCGDFCALNRCEDQCHGVSLALLQNGEGRLIVSEVKQGDSIRSATVPVQLNGDSNYAERKEVSIELCRYKACCAIFGTENPSSNEEACRVVEDFACEILSSEGWFLKLYPCLEGCEFCYEAEDDESHVTRAGL